MRLEFFLDGEITYRLLWLRVWDHSLQLLVAAFVLVPVGRQVIFLAAIALHMLGVPLLLVLLRFLPPAFFVRAIAMLLVGLLLVSSVRLVLRLLVFLLRLLQLALVLSVPRCDRLLPLGGAGLLHLPPLVVDHAVGLAALLLVPQERIHGQVALAAAGALAGEGLGRLL